MENKWRKMPGLSKVLHNASQKSENSLSTETFQEPNHLVFSVVILLSVLCRVCLVFPPLVSIFGLFPVLVKCDYEFILVQQCLSIVYDYLCIYSPVCSVWFGLVYSLLPGVTVCVCLAWPGLACFSMLKTVILSSSLSPCSSFVPRVCTMTTLCQQLYSIFSPSAGVLI